MPFVIAGLLVKASGLNTALFISVWQIAKKGEHCAFLPYILPKGDGADVPLK
jgi:hypothetical protein